MAGGNLEFLGPSDAPDVGALQMLEMGNIYTVTLMMGTINVSRGEARKMM